MSAGWPRTPEHLFGVEWRNDALQNDGYEFRHPDLDAALRTVPGK